MSNKVKITAYRTTEVLTRKQAMSKYAEGYAVCDGAEKDRYGWILMQLMAGATEVDSDAHILDF